jgi:hypothetical protein
MKTSQRSLIVASLVVLAIALACYCLDYQTHEAYRVRDQLLEPHLFEGPPLVASPVLIKFGEAIIEPGSVPHVVISGLYPRGSITPNEAAIGGLLAPFLLLVAAAYVALGALRGRTARTVSVRAGVASFSSPFADSVRNPVAGSDNFILIAAAIFPILLALDMPSVMLLGRLRLPKWVFALLVLRALANAPGGRQ